MKPKHFEEANDRLLAPPGQEDEVEPMPVMRGYDGGSEVVVSCWELELWERLRLLLTGELWLGVQGKTHPPLWLTAEKPVEPSR